MSTNTITPHHEAYERFVSAIAANRGWFTLLGIITILAGLAAIAFPLVSTVAVEQLVGTLFAAVGVAQIIHAFGNRGWGGFFLELVVGAIYIVAGFLMVARPVEGTAVLTIAASFAILADGIVRVLWSTQMPRGSGWGWVMLSGIIACILGIMLLAGFPFSATVALGTLAGINFLVTGWATLILALSSDRDVEGPADQAHNA